MKVKSFKPTTPALRKMVVISLDHSENKPEKSLTTSFKRAKGRNNNGRITSRHRGGGSHRLYRIIDFKRKKINIPATVMSIEYDPNRTCHIALISYVDGEKSYILAPAGLKVGDTVISSDDADIKVGNSKQVKLIPVGTLVHNVELYPGSGGQIARTAGSYVQLMAKEDTYVLLRMPSGELRKVSLEARATIGQVGNLEHEQLIIGKAGKNRNRGWRPYVRGVAMNPVDHPLGGGEGKSSGGRHPCSPWGWLTKGKKTRKNKRTQKSIVKARK